MHKHVQVSSPYTPKEISESISIPRNKIENMPADKQGKKLGWVLNEYPSKKAQKRQ
jgi:hypothetical protein